MQTFILILVLSTSSSGQSGSASVTQEFSTKEKCLSAGALLIGSIAQRGNYVLTWGCFPK